MRLAILLALMLFIWCDPVHAIEQDESQTALESLVKDSKPDSLESRLKTFLSKHKVRHPELYARLLAKHPMQERKKKLLAAILLIESKGNAMASSCENAKGAWQVKYGWKKKLHITGSLFDPSINLNAAVRVFDIHLSDAKGNERRALKAYSGGSHWYPKKVMLLASSI